MDPAAAVHWLQLSAQGGYSEAQRDMALHEWRKRPRNESGYDFWRLGPPWKGAKVGLEAAKMVM